MPISQVPNELHNFTKTLKIYNTHGIICGNLAIAKCVDNWDIFNSCIYYISHDCLNFWDLNTQKHLLSLKLNCNIQYCNFLSVSEK